ETSRRFEVEQHLQHALSENRFHVDYQPIVDIQSGELRSLEALLRLNVEEGPISPEEFIPIAEDTGLILPVGEWVLRAVCRQIGTWRPYLGDTHLPVAVNLASEQMGLKNLNSLVLSAIYDNDLAHSQLQLEVTETSLMKDIDRAIHNMEEILRHGIDFSLDDFGTGYSSLSYLQRLPVTKVKLDRAFIQNIDTNKHDRILAKNIINLCHELGKITVAEGIETQSQLDTLRELGCDLGQGY
ncbi:EAL domain-containing protein, partial [Oceanospirillum sp. HFRX-1_2]